MKPLTNLIDESGSLFPLILDTVLCHCFSIFTFLLFGHIWIFLEQVIELFNGFKFYSFCLFFFVTSENIYSFWLATILPRFRHLCTIVLLADIAQLFAQVLTATLARI